MIISWWWPTSVDTYVDTNRSLASTGSMLIPQKFKYIYINRPLVSLPALISPLLSYGNAQFLFELPISKPSRSMLFLWASSWSSVWLSRTKGHTWVSKSIQVGTDRSFKAINSSLYVTCIDRSFWDQSLVGRKNPKDNNFKTLFKHKLENNFIHIYILEKFFIFKKF